MTADSRVIVSAGDEARVAALADYFDSFISGWMQQVITGFGPMSESVGERVIAALAMTLAKYAGAAILSHPRVADEVIEIDADALARDYVQRLLAAVGAPS